MVSAVLLDVGGTLWPDALAPTSDPDPRLEGLRLVLPRVDAAEALTLLRQALIADDASLVQDTHAVLARALTDMHTTEGDAVTVRRALCQPAVPGVQLFPGAVELLEAIRALGLRCVVLSNVQVRGAAEYWRDFTDLGVAGYIDTVVTSLDVGFRKPHPAMFEAAIRAAGCDAAECVMVGNSEIKDIQPAVSLGLRAIRVAIEEPPPATSAAHAVAEDLASVAAILRHWTTAES
jgi:putative hydrolase of the HAD superfamily